MQYNFKDLTTLELNNKKVLLRVDFNVPVLDGKIMDATRIEKSISTLEYLKKQGAIIIIISHFRRPKGEYNHDMSFEPILKSFEEILGIAIDFYKSYKDISNLAPGSVSMIENIRFFKEEEEGNEAFAQDIANIADIYVNDAFSCCHRDHASVTTITKYLPSYPGFGVLEELKNLALIFSDAGSPKIAIIGGKKISTKIESLQKLSHSMEYLIIGGAMANTFLKSLGYNIGDSFYEIDYVQAANSIINESTATIILPKDVVCLNKEGECLVLEISQLNEHEGFKIMDIGPRAVEDILILLRHSKTLVWNGPLGLFEDRMFGTATTIIAQQVAELTKAKRLFSIIGGGDTLAAFQLSGLKKQVTYFSTAGGAFLDWLSGKELQGIKALEISN